MEVKELESALEGVLFAAGEPVPALSGAGGGQAYPGRGGPAADGPVQL